MRVDITFPIANEIFIKKKFFLDCLTCDNYFFHIKKAV